MYRLLGLLFLALAACQPQSSTSSTVLYIGWDSDNNLQLFTAQPTNQQTTQLTNRTEGIQEASLTPDGEQIAYVTVTLEGETAVSRIHLLTLNRLHQVSKDEMILECEASCSRLTWAPDGRRLIYQKGPLPANSAAMALPYIWWLDTETGETVPVVPSEENPTLSPSISPTGDWVTYSVSGREQLVAYNFANGRFSFIDSVIGTAVAWHPSGDYFIMSDLDPVILHGGESDDHTEHSHDYAEAIHLFRVYPNIESREPLTHVANVDDGAPVFSPDGNWLIFGRKPVRTNAGRQLMLMDVNSGDIRPLTDDLTTHHGAVHWSADSQTILYQTVNTLNANPQPDIWQMDIQSGEATLLIPNAIQPTWLQEK